MNSNPRVLVTGSRIGVSQRMVWDELDRAYENQFSRAPLTVVSGAATGVDTFAHTWTFKMRRDGHDVRSEQHPVNWTPEGVFVPSAGHQRNQKMVNLGADLVLCFIHNNSAGATGCMNMAMRARLTVRVLRTNDQEEA